MKLEELLKSKERKILLPKYQVDEQRRLFNGKDLNSNKTDFLYGDINVKRGQFFLYEKIEDDFLYYPKLGIYLNALICDQTLEIEWFDVRRTWEWRQTYDGDYGDIDGPKRPFKGYVGDLQSEIQRLILWDDSMEVYAVWDKMPDWKELRRAYEKTIWFGMSEDDKRDRILNTIL